MFFLGERSRLKSAYYDSLKRLQPNSMKTVQVWMAQSRSIKAAPSMEDVIDDFQEVLSQFDKLSLELPKMVMSKIVRRERARLVSQNVPDRSLTVEPTKLINSLGKRMVKLNLPASYLLADALEFISLMNENLRQLELMSMRESEMFDTKDKLDMRRMNNMSDTFQEWKKESIRCLEEASMRVERAYEIYQDVGSVEQWKKGLFQLRRLLDKYKGQWAGDKDISLQAYIDGRKEMDKVWAEVLEQIPDDFEKDIDVPEELPKYIGKNLAPTQNDSEIVLSIFSELTDIADEVLALISKPSEKITMRIVSYLVQTEGLHDKMLKYGDKGFKKKHEEKIRHAEVFEDNLKDLGNKPIPDNLVKEITKFYESEFSDAKQFRNKGDERWIAPALRMRYLEQVEKLIERIENGIASKSMKSWLLKAHVILT